MPTTLSDPSPTLYAILAIVVLGLAVLCFRNRKRGDLIRLLIGIAALAGLFLIDKFVESPREEATRKMQEISAATKAKKLDDSFKNISESFSWNGMNKAQLLEKAKIAQSMSQWNGVDVADFHRADVQKIDDGKIKIGFEVWPAGYGIPEYRYFCWGTFVKDPDGQFRMQTFDLYKKRPNYPDEPPVIPEQIGR